MAESAPKICLLAAFLATVCLSLPAGGAAVPDSEPKPQPRPASPPPPPPDPDAPPPPPPPPPPSEIEVELELTLLVDSSNSVDDTEFTLQRQGYIDAFRDPDVQAAIVGLDGVVVSYYEWSGYGQRTSFGDRLLKTEADCEKLASMIEAFDRHYRHSTNMAGALNSALWRQRNNRYVSRRQVIDVSGDGICENEYYYRDGRAYDSDADMGGRWIDVLRRRPDTTVINGISIGSTAGVVEWYETTVPQGTGSFTMNASTFEEFGDAIKQKLLREIVATPISYD